MAEQRGDKKVKVAIITGIFGVITATITGILGYMAGGDNVGQKIDNKVSQVVEVHNGDYEGAIDYIINDNKKKDEKIEELSSENQKQKDKIAELEEEIDSLKLKNTELSNKTDNSDQSNEENDQITAQQNLEGSDFLKVCPPYDMTWKNNYEANGSFKMSGQMYSKGFTYCASGSAEDYYILFDLGGKYSKLEFDLGHVDGDGMLDATIDVILDGVTMQTIEKKADTLVSHEVIELNYAKQLKLCFNTGNVLNSARYGLANLEVFE